MEFNNLSIDYELINAKDNIIYTKNNNLYGYIVLDDNYKVIKEVKPKYKEEFEFDKNLATVKIENFKNNSNKYNLIDKNDNRILKKNYYKIEKIADGYYKCLYINRLINFESEARNFIINEQGKIIYKADYYYNIVDYKNNTVLLEEKKGNFYKLLNLDTEKKIIFEEYVRLNETELLIKNNNEYNYKKVDYNINISDSFHKKWEYVEDYKGDYALVKKHNLFGLIDKNGNEIIKPEYVLLVYLKNDYVIFHKKYEPIYMCKLNSNYYKEITRGEIRIWPPGIIAVENNSLWGGLDLFGNEIIPCKYNKIKNIKNGCVVCELDDFCYFIDKNGRQLSRVRKSYSSCIFKDNLLVIKVYRWKNDKVHYANYLNYFKDNLIHSYLFECDKIIPYDKDHVIIDKELVDLNNKYRMQQIQNYYHCNSLIDYIKLTNPLNKKNIYDNKKLIKK